MQAIQTPFTNAQLEIIQLFSSNLNDTDLSDLKRLLIAYKAERLARKINQLWEDKKWSQDTMDSFLEMHLRTPYKSQNTHNEQVKNNPK